jgi:spore maturation protein CgeB
MRLAFFGLSLSSSWGNGHATTYRALLRGLAARGHEIAFFERERPWYSANRDLLRADFCTLRFYSSLEELEDWRSVIAEADAVVVGSFVPEAIALIRWIDANRSGLLGFYDIDTPVTLRKLAEGDFEYLSPAVMPLFDLYLSFTGGPALRELECRWGVRCARALYCSVDAAAYRPTGGPRRWDLGYLGTYSTDRQEALGRLLIDVAIRLPERRFVVAGAQYPQGIAWPENVERIEHLPPDRHAEFYSSLGWALNVTRTDMVRAGYSPSVRLFEATACGAPVLTDAWPGLDDVFAPGRELLVVAGAEDVFAALGLDEARRVAIGREGRARTLAQHTGERRAGELEMLLQECRRPAMKPSGILQQSL